MSTPKRARIEENLKGRHYLEKYVLPNLEKPIDSVAQGRKSEDYTEVFNVQGDVYMRVEVFRKEAALGDQVLKSDHFAGVHKLGDTQLIDGAPNFRRVEKYPVYGIAQPTVDGIEKVLKHLLQGGVHRRVIWVNLREEPVVYVNGHPYSPREPETLNINLDYLLGIEGYNLEDLEMRLRADIIRRSQNYDGEFDFYHQALDMSNEEKKTKVDFGNVSTLRDLYTDLQKKFPVIYYRLPITDESAPSDSTLDELVRIFKDCDQYTAVVFNCQMGRGRTTTGMCVVHMLWDAIARRRERKYASSSPATSPLPKYTVSPTESHDVRREFVRDLENGEFEVVMNLVSHLHNGTLAKEQTDQIIDRCDHLQNLRSAIAQCKRRAEGLTTEGSEGHNADFWRIRGHNYLERYWRLILFNAYLNEQVPQNFLQSFQEWLTHKWGLKRMLRKISLE